MGRDTPVTGKSAWLNAGVDAAPFFGLDRSPKLLRGWDSPPAMVPWLRHVIRMVFLG